MIWFIIATLVAFFIKGLCGFANTLIFNGILSYTANNINISPLEVVLGYPSNIILVWKERKSLNWKIWLPLTALVVAGSIPGIFLLKHTDAGLLKVIFGIAVIVIGVEMLFREMKSNRESSNRKPGGSKLVLVLIGITMALVLNLFYDYGSQRKALVENMRYTEERLQMILGEISAYLANKEMQRNVWDEICALEKEVQGFIQDAYEYQDNTFQSHPGYYIDYFEMRMKQCNVIHNLHYEMKKIRHMPDEAMIISSYVFDMLVCVKEHAVPTAQLDELHELFAIIRNNSLPKTREEFESRAMLYHILMDLEEFLVFKRRFVDGLDDKKRKLYWDN